jgi:hypothetical protein
MAICLILSRAQAYLYNQMDIFQDDHIIPVDLFSDWNQEGSNENQDGSVTESGSKVGFTPIHDFENRSRMLMQVSEKEQGLVVKDSDLQDFAFEKVPASPDGSSQILSQLTFLACNTKAQTVNTEKVQCRMMRAIETIERQQKENQVQTA